uniref:RING-H2 zinc finger protein RHA4a-like n=2 Tax=Nicotiana TaxID=4085 RepID=A0A1S4C692_TOBAC|nr:PREDICTED: RING-H2 zinc finger protein RHA4a-like [Nicotiana sylvestris]XP_016496638.1 PREDICTED: RING-H2 zinc finger protein RHA4a-like [Nicotiana tabacum]
MGFLFHAIELPKFMTAAFLVSVWCHLKCMVIVALTRLGLYKPPPEDDDADSNSYNPNSYILLLDGTCPSLVTVPIEVATAAVKLKVPVLLYRDYLLLRRRGNELVKGCSICLESMELEDEVRELITCTHVFHRGCLDTWVNDGHVTCPLCRSMLLPPKLSSFRCCRNPDTPPPLSELADPPLISSSS